MDEQQFIKKKEKEQRRRTREIEDVELTGSALNGEKPGREVLPKAVKLLISS